jgi:hypothetical protein
VFHEATSLNPKDAQAYWGLGKARAVGVDEFDSDPEDPADPSHCYAQASALRPSEFMPDGTRVRSSEILHALLCRAGSPSTRAAQVKRVEPMTPEREESTEREAKVRREKFVSGLADGSRQLRYPGDAQTPEQPRDAG